MVANVLQFQRGISLTVIPPSGLGVLVNPLILPVVPGTPQAPQIRIQFSVEKTLSDTPPQAKIKIFNLGLLTRNRLAAMVKRTQEATRPFLLTPDDRLVGTTELVTLAEGFSYVRLQAGYGGSLSTIFEGTAKRVLSERSGTDWITTIEVDDGGLPNRESITTRAFFTGEPALSIVNHVVGAMGLLGGTFPAGLGVTTQLSTPLTTDWYFMGKSRDALAEVFGPKNIEWWVDEGVLWAVDAGSRNPITGETVFPPAALPGIPVVVSSIPTVGSGVQLLETPKRTESDGVKIRCLLAPSIRVGRSVALASLELAGQYRCEAVSHQGDNRGGQFETTAYLRSLFPIFLG